MQRILRPTASFTSISLIALWHIGQSGVADWVWDMMEVDGSMLEALEDYVKRQKKRLGLPAMKEAAN